MKPRYTVSVLLGLSYRLPARRSWQKRDYGKSFNTEDTEENTEKHGSLVHRPSSVHEDMFVFNGTPTNYAYDGPGN
jgi:hypothetical protein